MNPLRFIDDQLNGITMYRLLVYGLGVIAAVGIIFSFLGVLSLSGTALLLSLGILVATCYVVNKFMALSWGVVTNNESWLITALILFCIMPPASTLERSFILVLVALLAMASKFMLAIRGKHLFNPAALAAAIVGTAGLLYAVWWVGSDVMLPFTMVLGLLVVRKIRRFRLFLTFLAASLVVMIALALMHNQDVVDIVKNAFEFSPLIFLGTIMLTEPSTMPPQATQQMLYGGLVGVLYAFHWKVLGVNITPEVALVLGNVYAYAVSPKYKLRLKLKAREQLSERVYNFRFTADRPLAFAPGQYLEWTLPHHHVDVRGNRRTFSIASSPTEKEIQIGVKMYQPSSSFKKALLAMKPGATMMAGQLAGDFILPKNPEQKLVFIAGGIGITPFRSMLKYIIDNDQQRDIILFYAVSTNDEVSYKEILKAAEKYGVKIITQVGQLDESIIKKNAGDFKSRIFYLSGPNAMVESYKSLLVRMGVPRRHIKVDYFAGY